MGNNGNQQVIGTKAEGIPPELLVRLESLRCMNCKRFLGYYAILEGSIVIKCSRCKSFNIINITQIPPLDMTNKELVELSQVDVG